MREFGRSFGMKIPCKVADMMRLRMNEERVGNRARCMVCKKGPRRTSIINKKEKG